MVIDPQTQLLVLLVIVVPAGIGASLLAWRLIRAYRNRVKAGEALETGDFVTVTDGVARKVVP